MEFYKNTLFFQLKIKNEELKKWHALPKKRQRVKGTRTKGNRELKVFSIF
jgi:hypothetical protein